MVSDSELVVRLREFLRVSDLTTTTTAIVRRNLQEEFGVDLTDRKAFIRDQVDLFLSELEDEKKDEDVGDGEEESKEGGGGDGAEGSDGEEEEEDEEETSNGGSSKKSGSNKHTVEVKKRGGGFNKLCSLSPQLQKFVGESELARTEVVKKLWAYIRENNLQDPSNRRKIICDEVLRDLFNVDTIDMFQMNKALTKHIWPLNTEGPVESTQKEKQQKKETEGPAKSAQKKKQPKKEREDSDEPPQKLKKQKVVNPAFLAPLQLSDALVKFIGTGESELPRSDVVKRIWEYIKQNNLQDPADKRIIICDDKLKELFQDPADKRIIICDDKLKELFQVDSFTGFTVPKLLVSHFIKSKE